MQVLEVEQKKIQNYEGKLTTYLSSNNEVKVRI